MLPNIKQRRYAKSRDKRFRTRAAEIFEPSTHKRRGMIGGGDHWAGETEHHQLYRGFQKKANQRKFGLFNAIGWNPEVLNRMECTKELRHSIIYA